MNVRGILVSMIGSLICLALLSADAEARIWAIKGSSSVDANYVRLDELTVVLKLPGGKFLRVPLDKLNAEDRDYVRSRNGGTLPGDNANDKPGDPEQGAINESILFAPRIWTDRSGL